MSPASPELLGVVLLTLRVAATATASILLPGILVAAILARGRSRALALLDALVSLPLVLPPTAVGLGLLLLFGPRGPVGAWLEDVLGITIAFTVHAAVLACAVVSFPLLVQNVRGSLEEIDRRMAGVARTLGCSPFEAFVRVELPLAWRGVMAGALTAFARSLGEFGATILVAGNIPGRTQTLALALFQQVQVGNDRGALELAGISAALAFAALLLVGRLKRRRERSLGDLEPVARGASGADG